MKTVYHRRICMTENSTQAVVVHDGKVLCVSIERPWMDNKPNVSCIPQNPNYNGKQSPITRHYWVSRRDSPKFGPGTWHVQDVPGRTHIIYGHVGNYASDVQGCMAFGEYFGTMLPEPVVFDSRSAVEGFIDYTKDWTEFRLVITDC